MRRCSTDSGRDRQGHTARNDGHRTDQPDPFATTAALARLGKQQAVCYAVRYGV